jgi:hypothetical protein
VSIGRSARNPASRRAPSVVNVASPTIFLSTDRIGRPPPYSAHATLRHLPGRVDNLTEPPALTAIPGEQISGLWLWHGAAPGQGKKQKTYARRIPRPGLAGVLLVTALAPFGWLTLTLLKDPEPVNPAVSSLVSPSSDPVSSTHVEATHRRDPAAEQPQAPAPAPPAESPRASRPGPVVPTLIRHYRHPRKQARTPLIQLHLTRTFRNGTLRPIHDR